MENERGKKKYWIVGVVLVLICVSAVYWFLSQKEHSVGTEPIVYHEIFEVPIDINKEPKRHKEVYEKMAVNTDNNIYYPIFTNKGFALFEVQSSIEKHKGVDGNIIDYGANLTIYRNESGAEIKIMQGCVDFGKVEVIEEINILEDPNAVYWSSGQDIGLSVSFPKNKPCNILRIYGTNIEKQQLINIAMSLNYISE